jgi:Holliday junction resolvase RusA-like endonuclease
MHSDEAFEREKKGAELGINPMFGDWQHRFSFEPVSYAAGAAKRAAFRDAIRAELKNKFF